MSRRFKSWAQQALNHLKKKGIGPGAIIRLDYPEDYLLLYMPPDPRDPDDRGMYVDMLYNELGEEDDPPPIFFVQSIDVFCTDVVLLRLIGGTCKQQEYFFPIDGLNHCLVFESAQAELNHIKVIQSSSFDHTHPTW